MSNENDRVDWMAAPQQVPVRRVDVPPQYVPARQHSESGQVYVYAPQITHSTPRPPTASGAFTSGMFATFGVLAALAIVATVIVIGVADRPAPKPVHPGVLRDGVAWAHATKVDRDRIKVNGRSGSAGSPFTVTVYASGTIGSIANVSVNGVGPNEDFQYLLDFPRGVPSGTLSVKLSD